MILMWWKLNESEMNNHIDKTAIFFGCEDCQIKSNY